jgi:hypothetical protein
MALREGGVPSQGDIIGDIVGSIVGGLIDGGGSSGD